MKCTPVDPETLDVFWEQIKPLLKKVVPTTYKRESVESIKEKIKNKNILLWIIWDNIDDIKGVVATKIIVYPHKRVCWWGFMAAKDNKIKEWFLVMVESLTKYSQANDCDTIEFVGRKGWFKQFQRTNIKLQNIGTIYEGILK
jgi:hypothetical protein